MLRDKPPDRDVQRAKWLAWKAGTGVLLAPIYVYVVAEGLRALVPVLAKRVALGADGAFILALFMLLAVSASWEMALFAILGVEAAFDRHGFDPKAYKAVVLWIAGVLLVADAAIFYCAMVRLGWRGVAFSFTALIATAAYLACLVFVSFVSCQLRKPLFDTPENGGLP